MNSFSDAVSNPKFQYRFNQSVFSPDEETEKVQAKMNDFLKGLPPLTPEISNSTSFIFLYKFLQDRVLW